MPEPGLGLAAIALEHLAVVAIYVLDVPLLLEELRALAIRIRPGHDTNPATLAVVAHLAGGFGAQGICLEKARAPATSNDRAAKLSCQVAAPLLGRYGNTRFQLSTTTCVEMSCAKRLDVGS